MRTGTFVLCLIILILRGEDNESHATVNHRRTVPLSIRHGEDCSNIHALLVCFTLPSCPQCSNFQRGLRLPATGESRSNGHRRQVCRREPRICECFRHNAEMRKRFQQLEGTPTNTGLLEISVGGELVHSKKGGDGYVDDRAKMNKLYAAVERALH